VGRGASHGIEFRLLGTVEVVAGDRVVEIGSPKQRTLLAALLLRLNIVVPADVLADELWG
jgi:DNA-binding SARP family transcriptional activator